VQVVLFNMQTIIQDGDFSNIPSHPGVYSWYYPLRIYADDEYLDFHKRVTFFLEYSLLDQGKGLEFNNKTNWRQWEINLKTKISPKTTINKKWDQIKNNDTLVDTILKSSIMFQPLYVGCAKEGLATRIQSHLNGRTGFAKRFLEACDEYKKANPSTSYPFGAFEIEKLHLTYTILSNKKDVEPFEDIIQSFTNPNFSKI